MLTDSDSVLLIMIWVENCWSKFWCYFIELSEFKQWLVLYQTFWVQVLLKFLVSDDEFNMLESCLNDTINEDQSW